MEIDDIEYTILAIIREAEKPMWKNRIHAVITEQHGQYPIDTVSVQTVGRRVDNLRDSGLLDSCIVSPEDIKRDLIIAFKVTDKGRDAKQEKEDKLLKQVVKSQLFEDIESDLNNMAIKNIFSSRFGLGTAAREQLMNDYDTPELVTLLTLYYAKRRVTNNFDSGRIEEFVSLIEQSDEIHDTFRTRVMDSVHT